MKLWRMTRVCEYQNACLHCVRCIHIDIIVVISSQKKKKKNSNFYHFPFLLFTFYGLIRDNSYLFTSGETVINMYPQPQSHLSLIDWHLAQHVVHNQSITIKIP